MVTKTAKQKPTELFISRYEILKKLGEGGVATVYQVLDRKENAVRALKVLKSVQRGRDVGIGRFEEEFRVLRHLHHPGTPEMYDYGVAEYGTRYMVMEYIEGERLDEYVARYPDELRLLLYEITEALAFIHEHNLLHLDLKPGNILVRRTTAYGGGEKPQIVLIDFGLSYRRDTGGRVGVSGTPAYMAPEIIQGDERLTRAVDYYSLGAMLFELIEGRLPFEGSLDEVLHAHLYKEVQFESETVEYADLYPHVRALMHKDTMARLEGFEVFRRMLAARESREVPPLERAYAMGYIESIGIIGKHEIWETLNNWTEGVVDALGDRREEMHIDEGKVVSSETKSRSKTTTLDMSLPEVAVITKAPQITVAPAKKEAKGPIKEQARMIVITGASNSGKSFMVEALRGECLMKGMDVWVLGEGGDYETLVSEEAFGGDIQKRTVSKTFNPQALIIDRFVRGWERLEEKGKKGGSVLIVDGHSRASKEERDFLEYVGKRLDLVFDEGREPGVFIFVSGRSPQLTRELKAILPKGEKLQQFIMPPPGRNDIEEILSDFHGRMTGVNDRRQLGEYLKRNGESSGAIIEALKQSVVRGDLVREEGRWRFRWTPQKARKEEKEKVNYYQMLFEELEERDREVVSWLSCHKLPLSVADLLDVSGITGTSLRMVMERLKPYRLIDVTREKGEEEIGIVNESAADGLYQGIPGAESRRIYEKYLSFFGQELDELEKKIRTWAKRSRRKSSGTAGAIRGRVTAAEEARLNRYAGLCEQMAFYYDRIGEIRPSFLKRVKALKAMKQVKDIFGMRRLCEDGIRAARKLRGKQWQLRKWHIERYFIKEWIEAEQMVENYRAIIDVVETNLIKRRKELPLMCFFRYGMALRWAGDFNACQRLLEMEGKYTKIRSLQRVAIFLLFEAALMSIMGKHSKSIILINQLMKHRHILSDRLICIAYVFYTLNYYYMGPKDKYSQHLDLLKQFARNKGFYNELLLAYYYEIDELFNNARYSAARSALKNSIKIASKMKIYHRLCYLHHLLSGVYYEEGLYEQAIKYVNKSIELASNLGLVTWTIESQLSISYNFEMMGSLGNSITYAERAEESSRKHSWRGLYIRSMLQLFNLFITIRNPKASVYNNKCKRYIRGNVRKRDLALYNYLLGNYYLSKKKVELALDAYKKAEKQYSIIGFEDDSIRSEIKIAYSYLECRQNSIGHRKLVKIKDKIKRMESDNLTGEYLALVLSYYYMARSNRKKMINHAKQCEEHLNRIRDTNIYLIMCTILFKVYSRNGNRIKGQYYFKLYHAKIKMITNQLRNPIYKECFINGSDYMKIREEAKLLMK